MTKRNLDNIYPTIKRILVFLVFLYLFLVSIELMGASFKLMGKDFAETLIQTTSNPLVGLFIGILATSIVQSSSATTSIVVGMIAAGTLSLRGAIPIIMGANLGTTVTNIIVSMGHITRPTEFKRAFAGATVHDFFNTLTVIIFLPLEYFTHYLEHSAIFLQELFSGIGGFKLLNPLKFIVKPVANQILNGIGLISTSELLIAGLGVFIAFVLLFLSLSRLVKLMKKVMIGRVEKLLHNYLFVNAGRSLICGIVLTAIIQSSSVVTSLVVPLVGAGILTIEQIFPYTLGANIGTTVTAMMASLVTQNPTAISAAFVHLLFNISGILVWYPLRKVPISIAKWFGNIAAKKRYLAVVYVVVVFYVVPICLALLTR